MRYLKNFEGKDPWGKFQSINVAKDIGHVFNVYFAEVKTLYDRITNDDIYRNRDVSLSSIMSYIFKDQLVEFNYDAKVEYAKGNRELIYETAPKHGIVKYVKSNITNFDPFHFALWFLIGDTKVEYLVDINKEVRVYNGTDQPFDLLVRLERDANSKRFDL